MSLGRRLILTLWVAVIVFGIGGAVTAYLRALSSANELLDYQLQQIAGFLAAERQPDLQADPRVRPDVDHDEEDDIVVSITTPEGKPLASSNPQWSGITLDRPGLGTVQVRGVDYRAYEIRNGEHWILVAQQMESRREVAESAALGSLLPILALLPVFGLTIFVVTRKTLRPLRALSRELAERPALSMQVLPTGGIPVEIQPLIEQMNALLLRLDAALEGEKRFIADAAHGLRTPLTALQLQADVLDGSDDEDESRERLAELRRGISRTARLAEHLLVLSRPGHRQRQDHRCRVDAVLIDVAEQYAPIADHAQAHIRMSLHAESDVVGDARLLAILFGNLIDNALRYTPVDGFVSASSAQAGDSVVIEIVDEGRGLPEAELERVFERFHRAPDDASEGSGLGLSAVRSIATDLRGTVSLRNRVDRPGLVAEVRLPRAPSAAPRSSPHPPEEHPE